MDITPYLPLFKLVHVLAVLAFVLVHGASALVAGVLSGIAGGWWTGGQLWLWASLVVFIVVSGLMTPIPAAYLNDVRHALGMATYDDTRRSLQPPPPASDQELARIFDSRRPAIGAGVGLAGVALLVYLMMFKPF